MGENEERMKTQSETDVGEALKSCLLLSSALCMNTFIFKFPDETNLQPLGMYTIAPYKNIVCGRL